jgi:hypothetical protein
MSVLELRGVSKVYGQGPAQVRALHGGWLFAGREPPTIARQPLE